MPYSFDYYLVHTPLKFVIQYICIQVQVQVRVSQHHLTHGLPSGLLAGISKIGRDMMDLMTCSG